MSAPDFVPEDFGNRPVMQHVAMPRGTELCFPAIAAAVSGAPLEDAHAALLREGVSNEDGGTDPPAIEEPKIVPITFEAGRSMFIIEPVETPAEGVFQTDPLMERIQHELAARKLLALLALHPKEESDSGEDFMHWTLLIGEAPKQTGGTAKIRVMDPKASEIVQTSVDDIRQLVDRSYPMPGAYVYAVRSVPFLEPIGEYAGPYE